MNEIPVGTYELRHKRSVCPRRVKAGQTIIVTEHGKAIGQVLSLEATGWRAG